MKKELQTLGLAMAVLLPLATHAESEIKGEKEKLSYSLGSQIGNDIKRNQIDIDVDVFARAMRDAIGGGKLAMTEEEIRTTMQDFQRNMQQKQMAAMKELADKNKKESDTFLAENKKKPGVVTLPSGVQYKVITEGKGKKPGPKDVVVANYAGTLPNGTEFDSSYKRGQPATFPLDGVIKGWQEVLPRMPVGSKWQVVIPPELAYGEHGAGQQIGPNQALVFEIELLDVKAATTPPKPDKAKKGKTEKPAEKAADKPAAAKPADAGK